jgi:DNA polymerase
MAYSMPDVERAGYEILLTVHDEIVTESQVGHGSVKDLCSLLTVVPPWAAGLPLNAEGFEDTRYHK